MFMVLQIDQDALDVVVKYTIETPDGASIDKMTVSIRDQVMVHTTADHTYYFGVPEDDPSNTYVDVAPTYTLVLDEIYEVVKEEMVGNIKFYNGALITNDQKLYLVKKK